MTPLELSAKSCTPAEMHSDTLKEERDLHWLTLRICCGDMSFVLSVTGPALTLAVGWGRALRDNGALQAQMGVSKIVSVAATIKIDSAHSFPTWSSTPLSVRIPQ